VQANLLTITGERKHTCETNEREALHEEFAYGKFERVLKLPEGVNSEKINAEFANGVLEITGPVLAVAQPRKIEIKVTAPYVKQIAA